MKHTDPGVGIIIEESNGAMDGGIYEVAGQRYIAIYFAAMQISTALWSIVSIAISTKHGGWGGRKNFLAMVDGEI